MRRALRTIFSTRASRVFVAAAFIFAMGSSYSSVHAQATINDRSLLLSNNLPGQVSNYEASMTSPAVPLLGSIKIEFCSNTSLFELSCTAPTGFSLASAALTAQSGEAGFSIHPASTDNVMILSRTPAASLGTPSNYVLTGVQNANSAGSQFARYSTYASDDGSGPILDNGGIAYVLNEAFGVTTEVPPHLLFCLGNSIPTVDCSGATGNYVSLGDFSPNAASSGQIQMVVATNAANGYTIRINGNTLTSGTNALPALTTPTFSAPGSSQFGINLRANTNPASGQEPSGPGSGLPAGDYGIANKFTFRPGDIVADKNTVEDYRKYTVTYMVNISRTQEPGIYSGTYSYVALGNF